MLIVDENGNYKYVSGTKTLEKSEHPVYQARIEVALGEGTWLCAPNSGHQLARFKKVHLTQDKREEFEKELRFYLKKYGPEVAADAAARFEHSVKVTIAENAGA